MGGHGGGDGAEPNLTPMLDMVFQLVTFFMLVMNFKAASMDLSLKLPVVGSARPVETGGTTDILILNVDKDGGLNVMGKAQDIPRYMKAEAQASVLTARRKGKPDIKFGDELPTTVVIRADQGVPFRLLNRVIKEAQDNGFREFALKGKNKNEGE